MGSGKCFLTRKKGVTGGAKQCPLVAELGCDRFYLHLLKKHVACEPVRLRRDSAVRHSGEAP